MAMNFARMGFDGGEGAPSQTEHPGAAPAAGKAPEHLKNQKHVIFIKSSGNPILNPCFIVLTSLYWIFLSCKTLRLAAVFY